MTTVLLVAVVVLTALTLVNLLLLFGVLRRLRDHEARFTTLSQGPPLDLPPGPPPVPAVGERVGDFAVTTADGRAVRRDSLAGPLLVGFFSPQCDACHRRLPDFVAAARSEAGEAVAVVVRDGGDVGEVTGHLEGIAVVVEDLDGPMATAFGVRAFPTFVRTDAAGTVRSSGFELALPTGA